jgi:hypothetical protein
MIIIGGLVVARVAGAATAWGCDRHFSLRRENLLVCGVRGRFRSVGSGSVDTQRA